MSATTLLPGILSACQAPRERGTPALECGTERLDYGQLAARVRRLAASLADQGVAAGSRVALAARRNTQTCAAELGLSVLGAACIPLDPQYPPARLAAMLETARADFVIGDPAALRHLPAHSIPELILEEAGVPVAARPLAGIASDRLAYILFTSGSTGAPKGVAMPRGPLTRLIAWHQNHPRLCRPARTLAFAPMSFDVHFQELHSTLATGGCLVLIDEAVRRDPASLLDALDRLRIERLFLPYVALQMLADAAQRLGRVPAALTDVISAGENLRITPAIRALFRALPQARLHNHYGPTETHVVTTIQLGNDPDDWPALAPIGRPLPHVKLALRAADAERPGQGELFIGGDCLADGYVGQERLTAEHFLQSPDGLAGRWYATGDLAYHDADGNWHCVGRLDAQTKIDGFRVEPGELERVLLGLAGVRIAAVDVRELPLLGRQLVAWVVPHGGGAADGLLRDLRERLRKILPEHLQPARICALDALPRTPSGKIDLKALRLPDAGGSADRASDPLTRVTRAWAQLLGADEIAPDANVFDLGARSLNVVRLLALLEAGGSGRLEVADVYAAPTPRGQAARLAGASQSRIGLEAAHERGARQRNAFARMRPANRSRHA